MNSSDLNNNQITSRMSDSNSNLINMSITTNSVSLYNQDER